jgi:hypothetical protein
VAAFYAVRNRESECRYGAVPHRVPSKPDEVATGAA